MCYIDFQDESVGRKSVKKRVIFSEFAYLIGIIFIALSIALIQKTGFGLSMIVAPAYRIHRIIHPFWSAFTFGMAEYCFQGFLIIVMSLILRRFRISFLFSFVTAVIHGLTLDGFIFLLKDVPCRGIWVKIAFFAVGVIICAAGVAMMFRTYLSPEAYELFVKEVSGRFGWNIHKFKTVFDFSCLAVAVIISLIVWDFDGIGVGTVICAVVNGFFISRFSALYDKCFTFRDALPLRGFFTGENNKK